jgi:hypothetical protein
MQRFLYDSLPRSTNKSEETNVRKIKGQKSLGSSKQNRPKIYLSKLSTCNALDGFFPTGQPKFPREFGLDNLNILIWPNS